MNANPCPTEIVSARNCYSGADRLHRSPSMLHESLLGHRSSVMTARYAHLPCRMLRDTSSNNAAPRYTEREGPVHLREIN